MKNNFPKIISDQFPYDMSPWITEKSEGGIIALIEIAKLLPEIEKSKDISEDTKHWIQRCLFEAMSKFNLLYAFSCGINNGSGNEVLLFEKHEKGLEEVKVKYGLIDKTTEQKNSERRKRFYSKLEKILKMEQYPGRSLLQELFAENNKYLSEKTVNSMFLRKIDYRLSKMSNGEITWEDFITEANKIYKDLDLQNKFDENRKS